MNAAVHDNGRYFTGKPCKRGHVCERYTSSGRCVMCTSGHNANRYLKNRDEMLVANKTWRANNPGFASNFVHARRARKLEVGGRHTKAETEQIFFDQFGFCNNPNCGVKLTLQNRSLDHVVPLSCGGTNDADNLQWLCQPCNDSKGVKPWIVFLATSKQEVIPQ